MRYVKIMADMFPAQDDRVWRENMRSIVETRRNRLNNRRHAKVSFGEYLSVIILLYRIFLPGTRISAQISPEEADLTPIVTKPNNKQSIFVDVLLLKTLLVTGRQERGIWKKDRRLTFLSHNMTDTQQVQYLTVGPVVNLVNPLQPSICCYKLYCVLRFNQNVRCTY